MSLHDAQTERARCEAKARHHHNRGRDPRLDSDTRRRCRQLAARWRTKGVRALTTYLNTRD